MSDSVKFTVIVPTRERSDTLVHCLRTLVTQDYDNVVFVVSDNFSQDDTKEVAESFNDPRIRYLNTGKRISMSHNWEFALGHVTDGWVTILGDDDGLLPGALGKISEIINSTGTEAIMSSWCLYYWPMAGGILSKSNLPLGRGWKTRRTDAWLSKLMSGKAVYPDLPMLYTGGFVDNRLIAKARGNDGNFFRSFSPDVYSAIALACVTEWYVYLYEPVSIAGVSAHSTGASNLGVSGNLKPEIKFYSENNIPFHRTLGEEKIKSIHMCVYESYLQSQFLHKNTLNISLDKQLSQALSVARREQYEELKVYCTKVCEINNLDIDIIEKKAKKYKIRYMIYKVITILMELFSNKLSFDPTALDAHNVYDVSLVFKSLYMNRWWRLNRIVGLLRRYFLKKDVEATINEFNRLLKKSSSYR